jgi:two-component system cell cycle sensor histidine kinase/response regulator CckA
VTFGLPRAFEAATVSAVKTPPVGGSETLLVVEDEDGVRSLVCDFLSLAGYQVLDAASPSEAERQSRSHDGEIRLLLTDVVMPEMSGLDLAVRLRERRPHLQVMFMSGFPEPTVGDGGGEAPGAHFIAKPFDRQGLLRAVRKALDDAPRHE